MRFIARCKSIARKQRSINSLRTRSVLSISVTRTLTLPRKCWPWIEGLDASLRFDDLKEIFTAQKGFSNKSAVAKRTKSALEYLDRVFPARAIELRNRSFIQSVVTLAIKLVSAGNSDGTEKEFAVFIKSFFDE